MDDSRNRRQPQRRVAEYLYKDEDNQVLYRVERFEPKTFRQSRPDGRDGWIYNLDGVRRVPYNAWLTSRAVDGGETIFVVEGEKDADRLVEEGFIATCFAGGTGGWRESYAEWFHDADLVIVPDNDGPGRKYAKTVADGLAPVARRVRVVELPGLPDKGDVSDWLDSGRTVAEIDEMAEKVEPVRIGRADVDKPRRHLSARRASEIAPEHVAWLWPSRLPGRRLTLVGGKPGEGKSALTMDLIARLTTASQMPDGYRPPEPITCAILSAEDDPNDTLVPRLIAAKADLERVHVLGAVYDDLGIARPWTLPDDVPELERYVSAHDIKLVVIDPLTAFLSASVDSHRDSAVRGMLLPLAAMSKATGCAVLGVRHLRKGSAGDPRDAGSGSLAFTAAARMEWVIGRDPQDDGRRVLATTKVNIAADPPSLAYRLVSAESEWETVALRWEGTTTVTASQLTAEAPTEAERTELDLAVQFLEELLADGDVRSRDAYRDADGAGISKRTLERAKQRLGVQSHKREGHWVWTMPAKQGRQSCKGGELGDVGDVGDLEQNPWSERETSQDFIGVGVQGRQDRQSQVLAMLDDEDRAQQMLLEAFGGVA